MDEIKATDAEVWRYFELEIRSKLKLYKEQLPTEPRFNHNGCPRTELTVRMESFMSWNGHEKGPFRQRVKQELPELELAFQREMNDNPNGPVLTAEQIRLILPTNSGIK